LNNEHLILALSRLITVTISLTGTLVYGYDLVGNRASLTYPDGKTAATTYNADNQELTVTDWDGGVTTYSYDAGGRLATTALPNGVQTTNSYDDANRLAGLRHVDTNTGALQAEYLYELDGLGYRQVATEMLRLPDSGGGGLQTTVITYNYDPLYRLTGASHTGGITAAYSYAYDAVGNMTAYTETTGAETSSVNRAFDGANRLLVSTDSALGTTSFYYDGNGNLVEIMPPGADGQNPAGTLRYGYNQRNLLITNTLYISGTGWVEQAIFTYDGEDNRVRQVDITGSQPVTTTYTNDNSGLSQVLAASTGVTTTHYLIGLDLISQDNGVETRILLADGLGSARTELVGNDIQTVTTYEPYGKLLARTGASGTVYGYTGEQYDSATSLVYLRARYYNPNLKVFMSRDPWGGISTQPATQYPYSYVGNNPVNRTDPGGQCFFAGIDTAVCIGVGGVIVIGVTVYYTSQYLANNPISIPMPSWVPNDWYLYPGKWIYEVCTNPNITPGTRSRTIEDMVNELDLEKPVPVPAPQPQPQPEEESTPPPPPLPPDNIARRKVLTVGDGDFGYSKALANNNPNWQIIGTNYGVGSNIPELEGFYRHNLILYRNVDATKLEYNSVTMGEQSDAIVFNNPRATTGWYSEARELVNATLRSAWNVLKPGGEMRFSGTGRMPATGYLYGLVNQWPPPTGYSNSYRMEYYADPLFGVYYQPLNNYGKPLRSNLQESNWYAFVK